MRRDFMVEAEARRVALENIQLVFPANVSMELGLRERVEFLSDHFSYQLQAYLAGKRHKFEVNELVPATWWDAVKERFIEKHKLRWKWAKVNRRKIATTTEIVNICQHLQSDPKREHLFFVLMEELKPPPNKEKVMKFRAWDEEVKHMYYDSGHITLGMDGVCINLQTGKKLVPLFAIGLHDRKQRVIFSGDIIKSPPGKFSDDPKERVGVVEFTPLFGAKGITRDTVIMGYEMDESEVIGNIYENPELKNI
jgi:hypothetical protein